MEYGGYTEKVPRAERMLKGQIEDMRLKERRGDGQTEGHVAPDGAKFTWRSRQFLTRTASTPSTASPRAKGISMAMPTSMVNLKPTCSTARTKQTMKHPIPPIPVMNLKRPYP